MGVTKKTFAGVSMVVIIMIIIGTVWFFWPANEEEIVQNIKGDSNTVNNNQAKEMSLIHIDNLRAEHHKVNIVNWSIFGVIIVVLVAYGAHYRMICVPKNIERRFAEKRKTEKLDEVQKQQ